MIGSTSTVLIASLVAVATIAGCTKAPFKPIEYPDPQTASTNSLLGRGSTPQAALGVGVANMTDCAGHRVALAVLEEDYGAHLPPGFKAHEQFPMMSSLFLDAWRCRKAAVDGKDIGPVAFHLTLVVLDTPPGRAPRPDHWYVFVFDAGSPDPTIREFFRPANVTMSNASIAMENEPLGPYFVTSHLAMAEGGDALYDVVFETGKLTNPLARKNLLLFEGKSGSRLLRAEYSGAGSASTYGGVGQWKAGSTVDRIAPGGTVSEIAGSVQTANILFQWE